MEIISRKSIYSTMRGGPFRPLPVVWAYAQKSIFKRVSKWTNGFSSQSMHTLAVWAKRLEIYRRSWKVRQLHFHKNSKMDLRMFHNISRTCSPKICQMGHIFIIWKYSQEYQSIQNAKQTFLTLDCCLCIYKKGKTLGTTTASFRLN